MNPNSYVPFLEAEVEFYVYKVVVLMDGTLVDEGVFHVQLQVFVEEIVGTDFVVGLACAHLFFVAIAVVAGLDVEFLLDDRSNAEGIPTVGLVAVSDVGTIALAVDVFSTEGPVVLYIFSRKGMRLPVQPKAPMRIPSMGITQAPPMTSLRSSASFLLMPSPLKTPI